MIYALHSQVAPQFVGRMKLNAGRESKDVWADHSWRLPPQTDEGRLVYI